MTAHAETLKPKNSSSEVLKHIEATKPLLLNMAEQVLDTERDRWNVIIGDDAGGRLPAHFIHSILKQDGRDMKTFFVANSARYRNANGPEPYEAYFDHLAEQLGEPLRPLVVTESVGTGSAVDFLRTHLRPYSSQEPEIATVAVREESVHKVNFAGGVGAQEIKDVWHAYESPAAKLSLGRRALKKVWKQMPDDFKKTVKSHTDMHLNPPTTNTTVGIYVDVESSIPVVKPHPGRDGRAASDAYRLMDELAADVYETVHENAKMSVG